MEVSEVQDAPVSKRIHEEGEAGSRPFGPVAAVFLAAGIGSVILGILTTLTEANDSIKDTLQFNDRVGPLSGKTIVSVIVFLGLWGVLHAIWRTKDPAPGRVFLWTWILLAVGLVLTFPIFFQLFES
jgi:uncharacterized membrane protein YqaE (UPF0057 family)